MTKRIRMAYGVLGGALVAISASSAQVADGWLGWRGPDQVGVSHETGLPDVVAAGGQNELWTYPIAGRGTPVIAGKSVYTLGYEGEGKDLQEVLLCLDASTGEKIWEHRFNDFLSDVIYNRYSIGSPVVDAATGNVYALSAAGEMSGFTGDGHVLWQRSMLSEFGRITFPNGRTGFPVIDGDRVIIHVITANWGPKDGPARDRFFAFDKQTGELIWSCTPGTGPKDSSFSTPFLADESGRRVLYSGTGCGHLVCIDVRTGDALWRFPMATGGVNSSPFRYGDQVIAIHGKENIDRTTIGRMVSVTPGSASAESSGEPVVLGASHELWRNDLTAFTSSPVLVENRIYQTVATGELSAVDADTGAILWHHKLAPDQIHASPLFADGKLYVPMNNGTFHIVHPTDAGPQVLCSTQLEGNCLGAPSVYNGQIYVHTTAKLYCFGIEKPTAPVAAIQRLQVTPYEVLLSPGETQPLRVRGLDEFGNTVALRVPNVEWSLRGAVDVSFNGDEIVAPMGGRSGVGFVTAKAGGVTGELRVRVVAGFPYREDFEAIALTQKSEEDGVASASPPGFWIGAFKKFDVRDYEGSKVLAKTLENSLFQRSIVTFGQPESSNYTLQVDILADGNRRTMSTAGLVNQRYLVLLKGNHQEIEVSSNMERIKESVPFAWKQHVWYTLKTMVSIAPDGSGIVRAKAWPRDDAEPEAWNIEVTHRHAHTHGAPGLIGFAPQSRFRVYLDNLQVIPND